MKLWKKMLIGSVALSIVAGSATTAFAANPGKGKGPAHPVHPFDRQTKKNIDKRGIDIEVNGKKVKLNFDDVEKESAWALQYIAELVKRGVFTGYEDGSFRPNQKVTRIEAITAAVRQMGLRDEAESDDEMSTELNFKDADLIEKKYPWAVGYVAVAVENDLFLETESQVNPSAPADRLWATILLVKALGLEDEAKEKMNTELSFKDKKEIPAGSIGYVAVALEKDLITGYENNTFRPNQPVTRAELAAILDRTGDQLPVDETGYGEVKGTFAGLANDGKVKITAGGETKTYGVDDDVTVLRDNRWADVDDLVAGDKVTVVISNNVIIYMNVTDEAEESEERKTGVVTAIDGDELTIVSDGESTEYEVDADADITRDDEEADLDDIEVGDRVTVDVSNGDIVKITVTYEAKETDGRKTGTVTAVGDDELTIAGDGKSTEYDVWDDAAIVREGEEADLDDIEVGDRVTVVVSNRNIVQINVTTPVSQNGQIDGMVTAVYDGRVEIYDGDDTVTYSFDANATIIRHEETIDLDSLQLGDEVRIVLAGGKVLLLTVTEPVSDDNSAEYTVTGKYQGHETEDGELVQISISTTYDGGVVTRVYNVAEDADVEVNTWSLEEGETDIELEVEDRLVTKIELK